MRQGGDVVRSFKAAPLPPLFPSSLHTVISVHFLLFILWQVLSIHLFCLFNLLLLSEAAPPQRISELKLQAVKESFLFPSFSTTLNRTFIAQEMPSAGEWNKVSKKSSSLIAKVFVR
uniref:Uncharacterized protein n=1 Tax=Parascaris univalens TaxID=6257 RepID=A0A915A2T1_PARUN